MSVQLEPYIFFEGNAQEAVDFYSAVFGGSFDISHYEDIPMPAEMEPMRGKIMHAQLKDGDISMMLSDTPFPGKIATGKIDLSLSGDDEIKLKGYWDKLAEGGTINQPLAPQPWGDTFGMLTDRFGIDWMVNISASKQ